MTVDVPRTAQSRVAYEDTSWSSLVPSEEIQQFAITAREHFASIFPAAVVRAAFAGTAPDASLWAELVDQGYTSVGIPEDLGGDGTLTDLTTLLEVSGGALVPLPLLASAAAVQTMVSAGFGMAGVAEEPWSLVIARGGAEAGHVDAFDGRMATRLAVLHETGGEVALDYFEVQPIGHKQPAAVDASRAYVSIDLGRAKLLQHEILRVTLDQALAAARVCVSADLVGVAAASLDLSITHVLARQQFGRPLGAFQAIKHMLADMYVGIERARSLTLGAAAAVAQDPLGDSARHLSMLSKATSAEIAIQSAAVRVQLMGAMGLTYEVDAHLYVRRAQQTARFLGDPSALYVRVAADRLTGGDRAN